MNEAKIQRLILKQYEGEIGTLAETVCQLEYLVNQLQNCEDFDKLNSVLNSIGKEVRIAQGLIEGNFKALSYKPLQATEE